MKLTEDVKAAIDAKSYEQLLERWRNAPLGDLMFQDETGEYWSKRMTKLRDEEGGLARHVAASKSIGWDG